MKHGIQEAIKALFTAAVRAAEHRGDDVHVSELMRQKQDFIRMITDRASEVPARRRKQRKRRAA